MAYGYIRVRNLGMGSLGSTEKHNARQYEDGHFPENIKNDGDFVHSYPATNLHEPPPGTSLKSEVQRRLDEHDIKLRKNQNVAIEFVCGASKDFWQNDAGGYMPDAYFNNAKKWLEDRYGHGSVVARSDHYDESNPHCHFIVVPIEKKIVKWKNRSGSGQREEARLTVRDITGGREKLRKLQDDYFAFISPYGRNSGVEFTRGKRKAENELDTYVKETSHELGEIRAQLGTITDERLKLEALQAMKAKAEEMKVKAAELSKAAEKEQAIRHKNFNRGINSELDVKETPKKRSWFNR